LHFIELQTVRQKKNETPQEFGDRCRPLAQKTVTKGKDPALKKFHYDQARRMFSTTFISELIGNLGR
jgi:hypothetical protein